jgi:hypothetical protein
VSDSEPGASDRIPATASPRPDRSCHCKAVRAQDTSAAAPSSSTSSIITTTRQNEDGTFLSKWIQRGNAARTCRIKVAVSILTGGPLLIVLQMACMLWKPPAPHARRAEGILHPLGSEQSLWRSSKSFRTDPPGVHWSANEKSSAATRRATILLFPSHVAQTLGSGRRSKRRARSPTGEKTISVIL